MSPLVVSPLTAGRVSIPYEREGSFRHCVEITNNENTVTTFQFPTSGKGHSDNTVTIEYLSEIMFQFPTSGKGHSDESFGRK